VRRGQRGGGRPAGWTPTRRYRLWHDRAVFHFLTDPAEQARYRDLAAATVAAAGT